MNIKLLIVSAVFGISVLTFIALMSRKVSGIDIEDYRRRWEKLQAYIANKDTLSVAVLEADKLLDKALKDNKYKGQTMGERMVSAKKAFSSRDNVWMAHKLRNKIAHEPDVTINKKQAKAALSAYHKALKDLGAL